MALKKPSSIEASGGGTTRAASVVYLHVTDSQKRIDRTKARRMKRWCRIDDETHAARPLDFVAALRRQLDDNLEEIRLVVGDCEWRWAA